MLARMAHKYGVPPDHVLGHQDVAPSRKRDPGLAFPWATLHKVFGVGAWLDDDELDERTVVDRYGPVSPCPRTPDRRLFVRYLASYGYNTTREDEAIVAFKSHFTANQELMDLDATVTSRDMYWIWALVAKYTRNRSSDRLAVIWGLGRQ